MEHAVQLTVLVLNWAMEDPNIFYVTDDDKANNAIRIDIYIGSNTANAGSLVQACEDSLTRDGYKQTIIRNVKNEFTVDCKCSYNNQIPRITC